VSGELVRHHASERDFTCTTCDRKSHQHQLYATVAMYCGAVTKCRKPLFLLLLIALVTCFHVKFEVYSPRARMIEKKRILVRRSEGELVQKFGDVSDGQK
jgi:hypothetical protein